MFFRKKRNEKLLFKKRQDLPRKERLIGNYPMLKTSILRARTEVRRLVVVCLYTLHNKFQNQQKKG